MAMHTVHSCQGSVGRMREILINYSYFVVKVPDKARHGRWSTPWRNEGFFFLIIKKSLLLPRLIAVLVALIIQS